MSVRACHFATSLAWPAASLSPLQKTHGPILLRFTPLLSGTKARSHGSCRQEQACSHERLLVDASRKHPATAAAESRWIESSTVRDDTTDDCSFDTVRVRDETDPGRRLGNLCTCDRYRSIVLLSTALKPLNLTGVRYWSKECY